MATEIATTTGTLLKWTNYIHGWQPRYFILKNGILMYHKSEQESSFGCRGAIAINASTFALNEFDCCRFDVGVCDYVWYLRAKTRDERDKWILALEEQSRAFDKEKPSNGFTHDCSSNKITDSSLDDTSSSSSSSTSSNDYMELEQQQEPESSEVQQTILPSMERQPEVPDNPLWSKIDQLTKDQLYHAQIGLGPEGSTDGWQLFAEDGLMRLYLRELEIDGLVCDPLKAVHIVKGITGFEMCHRFFSPNVRFEWEQTLESMKVIETINENTLVFHQVHKRIWPAAQRDAVFWSHIRRVENPTWSNLSKDDINPETRPDLKLHSVWIVNNNSVDRPDIALNGCVRLRLTVSLVCETYIPVNSEASSVRRDELVCKIIYISTINPGGWAPASMLRAIYKKEYPKFLDNFSRYVMTSTESRPIVFE